MHDLTSFIRFYERLLLITATILSSLYIHKRSPLQSLLIGLYRFKSINVARIMFTWRAGLLLHQANLHVIKEQLLLSCPTSLHQASDTSVSTQQ